MKIELLDLTVRQLVDGYRDNGEGGKRKPKRMTLRMPEA